MINPQNYKENDLTPHLDVEVQPNDNGMNYEEDKEEQTNQAYN